MLDIIAVACILSSSGAPARQDADATTLRHVNELAKDLARGLRCVPIPESSPAPSANIVASRGYVRVANLYAVLALQTDRFEWIADLVDSAVENYVHAFRCAPGADNLETLHGAIAFLYDVADRIQANKDLPEDDPTAARIRTQRMRLEVEVTRHSPAPARDSDPAPRPTVAHPPRPQAKSPLLPHFSLQFFAGGGVGVVYSDKDWLRLARTDIGLAAGARALAGARKRHSFGFGFTYRSLFGQVQEYVLPVPTGVHAIHRFGSYARYGVFLAPRWFSAHIEGQLGLLGFPKQGSLTDLYLGVGGLLCVWNEAFCLTGMHYVGSRFAKHNNSAKGWNVGVALDVLRLVEHARERREGADE